MTITTRKADGQHYAPLFDASNGVLIGFRMQDGTEVIFQYSGGTTDHSATGSIKFSVCIEKVA